MSAVPPHLPSPSCNIEDHRKWQRIKILLVAVFFGLLAGVSGSAMILGWVWPGIGGGDTWIMSQGVNNLSRDFLEDRVRLELEDRFGTVYRDLSIIGGVNYLGADKKIGEAAFVSSDGWLVMYYPNYDGNYKNWRVLLKNGSSLAVSRAIRDVNSNLVYLKIVSPKSGAQFKVINFVDDIKPQEDVFVFNGGNWRHAIMINKLNRSFHLPHLDTAPSMAIELSENFNIGDLVVDAQGKVIGLMSSGRYVLPSYYISGVLPSVLSAQKISYQTLGVYGWFSQEQPILVKNEQLTGFVVTRVFAGDNNLKAGDIILEINGQLVTGDNLWYNVIGNKSVKLKVLRKDKMIELVRSIKEI
jgi:S1-C subfamily serine protease